MNFFLIVITKYLNFLSTNSVSSSTIIVTFYLYYVYMYLSYLSNFHIGIVIVMYCKISSQSFCFSTEEWPTLRCHETNLSGIYVYVLEYIEVILKP